MNKKENINEPEGADVTVSAVDTTTISETEERSIVRSDDKGAGKAPLWLITFTDVMALMLTFFVLLYAMSAPQEKKWEEISAALTSNFNKDHASPFSTGSQDVINIDRISKSRALDLRYLKAIMKGLLKDKATENVLLFQNGKQLVVSFPSDLFFDSGSAKIGADGKKILFSLSGILSRIRNRIEIVGHTDPRPILGSVGEYSTNRELSLARASSVAAILKDVGYRRPVTVRGLSSARYEELPEDMETERAYNLSRRVDIVLMDDDGFRKGLTGY